MKVVGIDPAPKRGLTVFDGTDQHIPPSDAADFMRDLESEPDVLICWDAPLTGPSQVALNGNGVGFESDFTQRPIESFFRQQKTGFKTPKGISVRGYSGCPHWTITRSLVGLPRVGPYDRELDEIPFRLATSNEPKPGSGRWIVEVHPAVAAWLWCRESWEHDTWEYKNEEGARRAISERLKEIVPFETKGARNDDELDARIAFALGSIWLASSDVFLLGDLGVGTLLLPEVAGLQRSFDRFIDGAK